VAGGARRRWRLATGWAIVVRMQAEYRSLAAIRAAVDDTYGRYGSPTATPCPGA
jgi:hypothetical protein